MNTTLIITTYSMWLLFSGKNDVFANMSVSWTFAVLVYECEGLQALLQNTPDMPVR